MSLYNKPLDQITEQDIQTLIDNKAAETRTLDYKETLYGGSDEQKKEFLYDVSSFANTDGGDLILGVASKKGVPLGLPGVNIDNFDGLQLQLDGSINTGLDPKLQGTRYRLLTLTSGKLALIIRIPRSYLAPHMVKFSGTNKFYHRTSSGKQLMDTANIKAAFEANNLADRIRIFRNERIEKIQNLETPVRMEYDRRFVLHIVPLTAFGLNTRYDLTWLNEYQARAYTPLISMVSLNDKHRYNLDGFVEYHPPSKNGESDAHHYNSYFQIFRNGIIEAVDTSVLSAGSDRYINSDYFEVELKNKLPTYLKLLERLGASFPAVVMVTMLGVKGLTITGMSMQRNQNHWYYKYQYGSPFVENITFDRNDLLFSDYIIESPNIEISAFLQPMFDEIWNAAGFPGCPNYTEDGRHGAWQ